MKKSLAIFGLAIALCLLPVSSSGCGSGGGASAGTGSGDGTALLDHLLRQLDASSDPVALFSSFVQRCNQDGEAANRPDGMLFVPGGMGQEFESAYAALKDNEYSGVVKTGAGLYLIMRLPVNPHMRADAAGDTLRYRTAYEYLYEKQVNDRYAAMKVKYTDAYRSLDLRQLFD